jgi:hypothetical protein
MSTTPLQSSIMLEVVPANDWAQPTYERPGLTHLISDPMPCLPVDATSDSSMAAAADAATPVGS